MKDTVNKIVNELGFEIQRFVPKDSPTARLKVMFAHHNIDSILDVGANIGNYARYVRGLGYKGRILSFEPLPDAHTALLKASSGDPLWTVAPQAAVGSEEGAVTVNISKNSYSSSILDVVDSAVEIAPDIAYVGSVEVPLCRIDITARDFLNSAKATFMKIDVQGFEKEVLDGAEGILSKITGMQIEMSLAPIYKNAMAYDEIISLLKGMGYDLHAIIPGFTDTRSGRMMQMDGLFFRS